MHLTITLFRQWDWSFLSAMHFLKKNEVVCVSTGWPVAQYYYSCFAKFNTTFYYCSDTASNQVPTDYLVTNTGVSYNEVRLQWVQLQWVPGLNEPIPLDQNYSQHYKKIPLQHAATLNEQFPFYLFPHTRVLTIQILCNRLWVFYYITNYAI